METTPTTLQHQLTPLERAVMEQLLTSRSDASLTAPTTRLELHVTCLEAEGLERIARAAGLDLETFVKRALLVAVEANETALDADANSQTNGAQPGSATMLRANHRSGQP